MTLINQPSKNKIEDLLSGNGNRIEIPSYQRSFSWSKDQAKDLFDDIDRFQQKHPGHKLDDAEYFLGAIVGVRKKGKTLTLIDGQQRIATLTILLSVIRDKLTPHDDQDRDDEIQSTNREYAKDVQAMIIEKVKPWKNQYQNRLELNSYDQPFFHEYIQRNPRNKSAQPTLASHKQIMRVRDYFDATLTERLSKMSPIKQSDWLVRLWMTISSCLVLVVVEAESEDDATEVFEVLNERGLGLSTVDLLRNFLLGKASNEDERQIIVGHWADVFLVSDHPARVQNFLRHFWVSSNGDVKARGLYREIKHNMKAQFENLTNDPVSFSEKLSTAAGIYRSLLPTPSTPNHDLNVVLTSVDMIGATALYPAALSALEKYGVAGTLPLMQTLLSYYLRWTVVGKREGSELETQAFKLAVDISNSLPLDQAIKRIAELNLKDKDLEEAFKTATLTKPGHRRYVLQTLENYMRKQAGKADEMDLKPPSELNVEHLYPQTPKKGAGLPDHDEWVQRIGNLTLLASTWNASIKNGDFATIKKPKISESIILLNDWVKKQTSWGPEQIAARQLELAKLAPAVWPLLPSSAYTKATGEKP